MLLQIHCAFEDHLALNQLWVCEKSSTKLGDLEKQSEPEQAEYRFFKPRDHTYTIIKHVKKYNLLNINKIISL